MLSHYVENGFKINYNATNFYSLISENFIEIDGYWFLQSQIKKYNEWKSNLNLDEISKMRTGYQFLFIDTESSAISWIFNFLSKPKEFSDIYTAYNKLTIKTNDQIPELKELLNKNFIFENNKYRKPKNKTEKEKIYKMKEKDLDTEFRKMLMKIEESKKKLKSFRKEALIHGLTKLYQKNEFKKILEITNKIQKNILESYGEIMDFVDIARLKTEG